MTRPRDISERVTLLSWQVTRSQVAEMLAIRLHNMHPTQCPIHPSHWNGAIYQSLVCWKLIRPEFVKGWPRGWRRARLTELGERVLLSVAERAMVQNGSMTSLDTAEDAA